MIPFRTLATATAVLLLALAGVWFLWPQWILTHWSLPYSYGAGFLSRRMACFFLAMASILWSLRKSRSAEARGAVVSGMIVACLSLISLGIWEYASGRAGWGIFFAIGLEAILLSAFLTVERGFNPVPPGGVPPGKGDRPPPPMRRAMRRLS